MMKTLPKFTILKEDKATIIAFFGRLDAKGASSLWQKITHQISAGKKTNLIFDLEKVDYLDTAGAAFICYLETYGKTRGFEGISSINLKQEYSTLLDLARNIRQKDFSKQRPQRLSFAFVYRIGKNEYETDYYNEFISSPAKMITEKIEESLYKSSYFISAQTKMKQNIDFRLSGKITSLYGDFQDTNISKAIIEIRMILEKKTGNTFQIVFEKIYPTEENIPTRAPDHLVAGWNAGFSKIVTQFINDFKSLTP